MAGLTKDGLVIARYPEIVERVQKVQEQEISPIVAKGADSAIGEHTHIFSDEIAAVYELMEAVNRNFDPAYAEGKNLDDLGSLIGIERLGEEKSFGVVRVSCLDGVTFPVGSVFRSSVTGRRFKTSASFIATTSLCYSCEYSVAQVLDSTTYTININTGVYSYTSDGTALESEILAGLQADINGDSNATYTASVVGSRLIITSDTDDEIVVFSDTYLKAEVAVKDIIVYSVEYGPIVALAGTVTELVSPIDGVLSVTNLSDFILGRLKETDEEFRQRFFLSGGREGKATYASMLGVLGDLDGVSLVKIEENDTETTNGDGLPPNSFEVIIQGGSDAEIAAAIWETKPLSIPSHGSTSTNHIDSTGVQRTVKHTRPTALNLALRFTYSESAEESLPDNATDLMASQALLFINNLGPGVDVIPKKLTGPIYTNVPGVDELIIDIQEITNPGDAPSGGSWQTTSLAVPIREYAQVTLQDISFNEV